MCIGIELLVVIVLVFVIYSRQQHRRDMTGCDDEDKNIGEMDENEEEDDENEEKQDEDEDEERRT